MAVVPAAAVPAQVHSALRDPEKAVFASFPEANGFRAIVRPVDKSVRKKVQQRLPFRIHFNELGEHAVYAALRGRQPLGLVHARTEEGKWGLIEIEWCLGLDLTIRAWKFHRCRSRYRAAVAVSPFAKGLIGMDVTRLSRLIDRRGRVTRRAGFVPRGGEELAATVLQSAIKTLILTDCAWREDLDRLRDLERGLRSFPTGEVIRQLLPRTGEEMPATRRIRIVRALLVRNGRGRRLGRFVATRVETRGGSTTLNWVLDAEGYVKSVDCEGKWPDGLVKTEYKRLEGRPAVSESPLGEAEEVSAELATLVVKLREPGRN